MPKIKWKVQPAPTGRYRSFQNRGWPSADYANGDYCAGIYCTGEDDYLPAKVKTGNHAPLKLRIRDYSSDTWKVVKSKSEYATIGEAKVALVRILEKFPHLAGTHQ